MDLVLGQINEALPSKDISPPPPPLSPPKKRTHIIFSLYSLKGQLN